MSLKNFYKYESNAFSFTSWFDDPLHVYAYIAIYNSLKKFFFGDLMEMQAEIVDETDVYIDVHKRYCSDASEPIAVIKDSLNCMLTSFQSTCGCSSSSCCIIHNTSFTSGNQETDIILADIYIASEF